MRFFDILNPQSFNIIKNGMSFCTSLETDETSRLPGMVLFNIHPKMKADNVLIITILSIDEPVLCCTAVSMIILCEQSTMTDSIVVALIPRSRVIITAMAA